MALLLENAPQAKVADAGRFAPQQAELKGPGR